VPRHHELNALLKRSMEKLTSSNVTVGLLELYPVRVTEDRILKDMGRYLTEDETAKVGVSLNRLFLSAFALVCYPLLATIEYMISVSRRTVPRLRPKMDV
jgi:hypothetical protein